MQPFSICCTTCKAKLRVRDEAALGEILACPKCGSMVLVTPPAANAEPSDSSASLSGIGYAAAMTLSVPAAHAPLSDLQFDDVAALISDDAPAAASAPPAATHLPKAASEPAHFATKPVAKLVEPNTTQPAPAAMAPVVTAAPMSQTAEATPVVAPPVVEPPVASGASVAPAATSFKISSLLEARWLRTWVIYGGSISAGIVLALAVVGMVIARNSGTAPNENLAVAAVTPAAEQAATPAAQPLAAAPAVPAAPAAPAPAIAPKAESPAPKEPQPSPSAPNAGDLQIETPAAKPEKVATAEAAPENKTPAAPVSPPPAERVASLPGEKPKTDEFVPSEKPPTKPAVAGDGLGEFGKFLLDSHVPEAPAKPAATPDARIDEVSQSRPPPRKIDLASRLADPIAAIDLPGVSLAEFAQLLSDMSTIPVTIDPFALQQLGLSSETTIVVKQANTTVGQVLAQTLKNVGLTFVMEDGHVRIVRPAPEGGLLRRVRYDVSDLVADDPAALTWLSQLLPQFIAPATWTAGGGAGKLTAEGSALVVEQSDAVHFQNLLLIEKLRLARGKAQRSRVSPALLKLEPAAQRAAAKLAQPLNLNYIRPTRLTQILARVHETTGMRVLVDWPAVYEANWPANAETRVSAAGESTAQALDKLLRPMDLAWRVIDEQTIQVSTDRALTQQPELALYNVRGALATSKQTPEKLLERLRTKFGASAQFAYDPGSQHLLALVAAPQHDLLRTTLAEIAGK